MLRGSHTDSLGTIGAKQVAIGEEVVVDAVSTSRAHIVVEVYAHQQTTVKFTGLGVVVIAVVATCDNHIIIEIVSLCGVVVLNHTLGHTALLGIFSSVAELHNTALGSIAILEVEATHGKATAHNAQGRSARNDHSALAFGHNHHGVFGCCISLPHEPQVAIHSIGHHNRITTLGGSHFIGNLINVHRAATASNQSCGQSQHYCKFLHISTFI